jgi:hypothetical protein
MEPSVLIPLAILVAGALIGLAIYSHYQRRKLLAEYAASHGLLFDHTKDRGLDDHYPDFNCLRRGRSRYAYNRISGEREGLSLLAFDYHYETGSGKNRRTHNFSAVIVESPVPLKPLHVRPENFFDKITEFVGFDDIDFESAEFSRKFYVKSPDKRWAYDVIHPRMMEYLLEAPRRSFQMAPGSLIAWGTSRFKPEQFDEAFGHIRGILDRLPQYLFRD